MQTLNLIISIISIIVLLFLSFKFILNKEEKGNGIIKIIIFLFITRIVVSMLYFSLDLPPNLPDTKFYEGQISMFVTNNFSLEGIKSRFDVRNYIIFNGIIRRVLGNTWIVTVGINSLMGSFAIYYAGRIAEEISGVRAKKITIMFLFFEPTILIYTNTHLRESVVLFTIVIAFYQLVKYMKEGKMKNIIIFFVMAIISGLFRAVNIFVLLVVGAIAILMSLWKSDEKKSKKIIIFISIFISVILGVIILNKVLNFSIDIRYINENLSRDKIGGGTMPYLVGQRYNSWLHLLICIPQRLFYFTLYPFPWFINNYNTIIPTISSAYNCIFIVISIIGYSKYRKRKSKREFNIIVNLIIMLLLSLTIYSVAKSESAARHRLQFMWLLPVVVSTIIVNDKDEKDKNENKKRIRSLI